MFRTDASATPVFSELLELDLATVEPSLAGPRRPQDRVPLGRVWESFTAVWRRDGDAQDKALKEAHAEVEDQEDEHYYHTKGWLRELSMKALGLKAVLPPPEEKKHVKTTIGAARAEQARTKSH